MLTVPPVRRFLHFDRMENNKASSVAWPREKRSIEWVCQWSLCACLQQFTRAAFRSTLAVPDLKLLAPAQACNTRALQNATLWFSAAGAGAAVLAMLLKGRARAHRALACVALASAVAIHCVLTCFLGVNLVTAPNDDLLVVSVMSAIAFLFFAVVDANAALVLLRRAGGEE